MHHTQHHNPSDRGRLGVAHLRRVSLGLLAAAILAAAVLAGCGGGDDKGAAAAAGTTIDGLKAHGARLGVAQVLPEAGSENGKPIGIAPEITALVLKKLGVSKITVATGEFASVIPSLQARRIDLGTTLMYITPERCKAVLFSDPLVAFQEAMAVKKGNPLQLKTYQDVAKKKARLGVVTASFELKLARQAGVSADKIQQFPDLPSMFDGIKAGRVDAAGYDDVTIAYFVHQPAYSDLETTVPYTPAGLSGGAIAFPKDATALRDAFNVEQRKMLDDGSLKPVLDKWHVPQRSVELARSRTAKDFCAQK